MLNRDITYSHVLDTNMFVMLTKSKVYDWNIDVITYFMNMTFKEINGNAIIMKCYVKVWISIWCISIKCFHVVSSSMIWTRLVEIKLLAFYEKCYVIGH